MMTGQCQCAGERAVDVDDGAAHPQRLQCGQRAAAALLGQRSGRPARVIAADPSGLLGDERPDRRLVGHRKHGLARGPACLRSRCTLLEQRQGALELLQLRRGRGRGQQLPRALLQRGLDGRVIGKRLQPVQHAGGVAHREPGLGGLQPGAMSQGRHAGLAGLGGCQALAGHVQQS